MLKEKAVVVISGGLDSTVLLYKIIDEGYEPYAISFNYGQKHSKELECAKKTCEYLGVNHKIIDVSFLKDLLDSSLLNDDEEIPEGDYREENPALIKNKEKGDKCMGRCGSSLQILERKLQFQFRRLL